MGRLVDVDDLADANEVAEMLGLSHPNSVHTYARRGMNMPEPVVDRGKGRSRLWLRSEISTWDETRHRHGGSTDNG